MERRAQSEAKKRSETLHQRSKFDQPIMGFPNSLYSNNVLSSFSTLWVRSVFDIDLMVILLQALLYQSICEHPRWSTVVRHQSPAMAGQGSNPSLDSNTVFKQRVEALGLGAWWDKFTDASWTTFGSFAFACTYQPGMQDDSQLRDKVIKRILGSEDHAKGEQLRRLPHP